MEIKGLWHHQIGLLVLFNQSQFNFWLIFVNCQYFQKNWPRLRLLGFLDPGSQTFFLGSSNPSTHHHPAGTGWTSGPTHHNGGGGGFVSCLIKRCDRDVLPKTSTDCCSCATESHFGFLVRLKRVSFLWLVERPSNGVQRRFLLRSLLLKTESRGTSLKIISRLLSKCRCSFIPSWFIGCD